VAGNLAAKFFEFPTIRYRLASIRAEIPMCCDNSENFPDNRRREFSLPGQGILAVGPGNSSAPTAFMGIGHLVLHCIHIDVQLEKT
jgi:hypothetical protein